MLRVKFVALLLAATLCAGCSYRSPAEVQDFIAREIPIGTEKAKVEEFLAKNDFEYSGRTRPDVGYAKDRTLYAAAPGRKIGLLVTGKVYVTLVFDERDRLATVRAEEVLTGL